VLNDGVKIKVVHISLLFKNWIGVQTDETSNYGLTGPSMYKLDEKSLNV